MARTGSIVLALMVGCLAGCRPSLLQVSPSGATTPDKPAATAPADTLWIQAGGAAGAAIAGALLAIQHRRRDKKKRGN